MIKNPSSMKKDEHFEKYQELKWKNNDTIAQYLACESIMKKVKWT